MNKLGIKQFGVKQFEDYLKELKSSYFVVSPNGNGVDCHKTWEALYLNVIPILTSSINVLNQMDNYNYPFIIIDDWNDFNYDTFSLEKYHNIDIDKLDFNFYRKLINLC